MAQTKSGDVFGERFEITGILNQGGQGRTFLAKDLSSAEVVVVKILKRPFDRKSRIRFFKESAALKTLDTVGVPAFVFSNAERWESSELLFLAMEYIEGESLETVVAKKQFELKECIDCINSLLDTIEYCHSQEVYHRDIKPTNVIIRSSNGSPVIVDFGLSFNAEEIVEGPTQVWEHLGNRFLFLPELRGGEGRDPRSDLAYVCGLMLYMLSGAVPGMLTDENGKRPHEREETLARLNSFGSRTKGVLLRLFDRGLSSSIQLRFQSASELRTEIERVSATLDGSRFLKLQEMHSFVTAQDSEYVLMKKQEMLKTSYENTTKSVSERVARELGNREWQYKPAGKSVNYSLDIEHREVKKIAYSIYCNFDIQGAIVVLAGEDSEGQKISFSAVVKDEDCQTRLITFLRETLYETITTGMNLMLLKHFPDVPNSG